MVSARKTTNVQEKIDKLNQAAEDIADNQVAEKIDLAQQAEKLAKKIDYKAGLAESKLHLGTGYTFQSKHKQSLTVLTEALKLLNDLELTADLKRNKLLTLKRIGINHMMLGSYEIALEYFKQESELAAELDETREAASYLINIGIVYLKLDQPKQAADFLTQALEKAEHKKDKATALLNLSITHKNREEYNSARECLEESLTLFKELDYSLGQVENLNELGEVQQHLANNQLARSCYFKSLNLLNTEINNKFYKAKTLLHIGQFFRQNKKYSQAAEYLNQALQLAEKMEAKEHLANIHQELALVYKHQNKYEQSLKHHEQFHQLDKEIFNEQTENKLNSLRVQHNLKQAQKEKEELKKSYNRMKTISELGQQLISTFNIEKILNYVYEEINSLMDAAMFGIGLYDQNKKEIKHKLIIEEGTRLPTSSNPVDSQNSIAAWCIRNKETVLINDIQAEYEKYVVDIEVPFGNLPNSILCVPLMIEEKVIGMVSVQSPDKNAYTAYHRTTLEALASYLAIALDNTQRFKAEQEKRTMAERLQKLTSLLTSTLQLEEVLDRLLKNLSELINYNLAAVILRENNKLKLVAARTKTSADLTVDTFNLKEHSFFKEIIQSSSASTTGQFNNPWPINNINSWFGIPLITNNQVEGILLLGHEDENFYQNKELDIITAFAGQAAIAINNAQLFKQIKRLATKDSLTNLYNRRTFFRLAEQNYQQAQRMEEPLSIIMLDIDDFKFFNDQYGHLAGDKILKEIAQTCQKTSRQADITARYGGEEFVVLLPNTELDKAEKAANRLHQAIKETTITTEKFGSLSVTASLGVAAANGESSVEDLIHRADKALYRAKEQGKNQVITSS